MTKFIELTDYDDQPLMVNVANIVWFSPYKAEEGSMVYVNAQGKNDYPVSLCVKENYTRVTKLIQD